ncbi:hypothetical protein DSCA_11470 [Desulfosarcina alkanivorans]|uniref:Uncharacterized protein n=1 Tax=Desulfosarcina alkanivorans TaxID=571177 RepID=A0A5K7YRE7_9BACT|nr:glycosyltransferase family 1 protein [Desulfosarcina alkanivorans]BBO67217.1 hypothetical protein DSCA_11470 [Desulfosarcina alkanivorans]
MKYFNNKNQTIINVALEVSTVGIGLAENKNGKNMTGLFRVNTELTKALLDFSDVNFYLSFFTYPHGTQWGKSYFENKGYKIDCFSRNSSLENFFYQSINKLENFPKKSSIMRIGSRIFKICKNDSMSKDIDIFHSLYYPIPEFIKTKKIKRFRTIHDLAPLVVPRFFKRSHRRSFLKSIQKISKNKDLFFAVSQNTKNDLRYHLNIPEKHIFVTPLAACPFKFKPVKDKFKISELLKYLNIPGNPYFLSIATLEPRKNLNYTVQAFKKFLQLSKSNSQAKLLLVGRKGWLIDKLINEIYTDPMLKDKVILTGFVKDWMLSPLISGAVGFLYPSLYEGFGLPVLEAMQCGVPVITSKVSSLPEVAGNSGILVDPLDIDEMINAMDKIFNDESLRKNLAKSGIERAKKFSWEKCARQIIAGYQTALN